MVLGVPPSSRGLGTTVDAVDVEPMKSEIRNQKSEIK